MSRRRGGRASWPVAAWGLVLMATASAQAQPCLPMPGGGELTVAGLGRIVFAALTTDRARDAASLTGGVCIVFAAIDGVLRTERLELTGLSGRVAVAAADVALELPGWALTAAELHSDGARARLTAVAMRGAEAVALAEEVRFDLDSGAVVALRLRLATETVWMDAAHATFDGRFVWATDAWLTTCDCPPEESPVRLEAAAARLDLEGPRLRLEGSTLTVGPVSVTLPDPFDLDEEGVAALALPFTVGADPDGRRGLVVSGLTQDVAPGALFSWDAGSGEGARPPDVGVRLDAVDDGASASLAGGSDGLRVAWRVRRALAGGFGVAIAQRLEAGARGDRVRDQGATLEWGGRLERPAPGWPRFEVAFSTTAALSAQRLGFEEVAGPRLGVEARARAVGEDRGHGLASLEVAGGATRYPVQGAHQAWVSLSPAWTVRSEPWVVEIGHLSRWVAGASPFGVALDRRVTLHRTDVAVSLSAPLAAGWSMAASASLRLDWGADPLRPGRLRGVERLRVGIESDGPAWGGRLSLRAAGDLAAWVDARPGREAEATVGATWTRQQLEFGARVSGFAAGSATAWREAVVFASWPVTLGPVVWRPYLALDLASIGRDGVGWWSGHGLELAWTTCCGIVELGYRHDDALGTRLHAALRLETHPLDLERLAAAAEPAQGRVPALVTAP